ncbi:serine hydrolase [uncultured Pseudoteredinibacter sp.]|uniref:serine hydrolase domain-containing protein n=1 Tax=uncultured Pseudoteredinibacter sp. TaxID=1641701 RepID=UPI00261F3F4D|nr:serine hydrolase [uncultured Pseudoteredinibacter sp.]
MSLSQKGFSASKLLLGLLAILILSVFFFRVEIQRIYHGLTLFDKANIVENMRNSDQHYTSSNVEAAKQTWQLHKGEPLSLPETFNYYDEVLNTADYIGYTHTGSLLVMQHGDIRYENYFRGETENDRHISFSVAKSFISALFGIAVSEGKIDIDKNADDYLPILKGSGYEGVRIKDILQMSSGVAFNEDYADLNSDINRFGRILALGGSFDEFAASLENEVKPGTRRLYVSIDTQVLGMILREATGRSISDYMQEKLWQPMGAESDAYWVTDSHNMEMALGGLNAVLRDYARFGQLAMQNGQRDGKQIIPAQWMKDSLTMDAAHLKPKQDERSLDNWGYGYQWWLPPETEKHPAVFMAVGIYDQYIYIDRARALVIVKLSGNPYYTEDNYDSLPKTLALFRAIAEQSDKG